MISTTTKSSMSVNAEQHNGPETEMHRGRTAVPGGLGGIQEPGRILSGSTTDDGRAIPCVSVCIRRFSGSMDEDASVHQPAISPGDMDRPGRGTDKEMIIDGQGY